MTYINEFPHPQYVINYDPEPDTEPYGFDVLDDAITHRAHAIELHALYRQSDNSVVWAHNSDSIDQSKLLSKAIDYIFQSMVNETLYGDGLQAFVILTPHANDANLFDGLFELMKSYKDRLSTAVSQNDPPRGITFVISGDSDEFHARHSGPEVNSCCIIESVAYSSDEIVNLSRGNDPLLGNPPFQWYLYEHPDERGNVNRWHRGGALFNVRVWKDDDDLRLTLATGTDSANARPDNVSEFGEILLNQLPRGTSPGLAINGREYVLVWSGDSKDNNIYVAMASGAFSFSRQINFTWFHQDTPMAKAPAVAIDSKQNLLIVYEGTEAQRLWYVAGQFIRPSDFLTFNGQEQRLTLPDGGRRGSNPSPAISRDNRVFIVYEGTNDQKLWYVSGLIEDGIFRGSEFSLTAGNARRGYTPAAAFDSRRNVVVVYRGTSDEKLWYVSGRLDPESGELIGQEFLLSDGDARRGYDPAIAFDSSGHVWVAYEGTSDNRLWYVYGTLDDTGRIVGEEFELTQGDARRGTEPTIAFDADNNATIVYTGTEDAKLWYVRGTFDASGHLNGDEEQLNMSLNV